MGPPGGSKGQVSDTHGVLELSRFRDNSRERVLEGHLVFFSPMSSLGLLAPTTRSWASGERWRGGRRQWVHEDKTVTSLGVPSTSGRPCAAWGNTQGTQSWAPQAPHELKVCNVLRLKAPSRCLWDPPETDLGLQNKKMKMKLYYFVKMQITLLFSSYLYLIFHSCPSIALFLLWSYGWKSGK